MKNRNKYKKLYKKAYKDFVNEGNVNKAIGDYEKTIKLNPDFADAYYDLAYIYNIYGNKCQAIVYYEKYLEHKPFAKDREEVLETINKIEKEVLQNTNIRFSKKYPLI